MEGSPDSAIIVRKVLMIPQARLKIPFQRVPLDWRALRKDQLKDSSLKTSNS
jgi:hypothetical protein